MTVSVTSAAKPQKTRSIRKAMLRQRTEKNEWLESPHTRLWGLVQEGHLSALPASDALNAALRTNVVEGLGSAIRRVSHEQKLWADSGHGAHVHEWQQCAGSGLCKVWLGSQQRTFVQSAANDDREPRAEVAKLCCARMQRGKFGMTEKLHAAPRQAKRPSEQMLC